MEEFATGPVGIGIEIAAWLTGSKIELGSVFRCG